MTTKFLKIDLTDVEADLAAMALRRLGSTAELAGEYEAASQAMRLAERIERAGRT